MSRVYLVRHGQAGTREAYDWLSDLGRRQARLLGEYFVSEGIQFAAAYCGELARQEQTAAEVKAAYSHAGVAFPRVATDRGWNEFDLDEVYRALAPRLCDEDPEFHREYREMADQARAAAEQHDATVNRRWLPCDAKVVNAWMEGKHPHDGETWPAFRERVARCRSCLAQAERNANVAIFTSAVPIGIWTALAMDAHDERALSLAAVLHNASYTLVQVLEEQVRLRSFNAIPHLGAPELRTFR